MAPQQKQRIWAASSLLTLSAVLFGLVPLLLGSAPYGGVFESKDGFRKPNAHPDWGIYQIYWGPDHFQQMLERSVGELATPPDYVMFYRDLHRPFPTAGCAIIRDRGAIPVISLELWSWGRNPGNYLPRIAGGALDAYFTQWAEDARAYGDSVVLRFGFEMNGDWFTWGNQPDTFVRAWRRIHGIFEDTGADNVVWAWTPNSVSIPRTPENAIEHYYPGDAYVDWLGIDGYNFGDHHDEWHRWETFEEVFGPALALFEETYPDKPILLAEFGCAPGTEGQKAAWIREAYHAIKAHPQIIGAIWYNFDKRREGEPNWRIGSDPGALEAWNETFGSPRRPGYLK